MTHPLPEDSARAALASLKRYSRSIFEDGLVEDQSGDLVRFEDLEEALTQPTAPSPPAPQGEVPELPAPKAWMWEHVEGKLGVYFDDPAKYGIENSEFYKWTKLYTADQLQGRADERAAGDAGVSWCFERAADMLTAYAELIRRDGASKLDEHHYLPEVEQTAKTLRDAGEPR